MSDKKDDKETTMTVVEIPYDLYKAREKKREQQERETHARMNKAAIEGAKRIAKVNPVAPIGKQFTLDPDVRSQDSIQGKFWKRFVLELIKGLEECDGTPKITTKVLKAINRKPPKKGLKINIESTLEEFQRRGGGCDCEVLLNVVPPPPELHSHIFPPSKKGGRR